MAVGARWIDPFFTVLYADAFTGVGTGATYIPVQAGHKFKAVEIINNGTTAIIFFPDTAPVAGLQIVIPAGSSYYGTFEEFSNFYYKSSAANGAFSLILRGR